jgi:hypothetical protein
MSLHNRSFYNYQLRRKKQIPASKTPFITKFTQWQDAEPISLHLSLYTVSPIAPSNQFVDRSHFDNTGRPAAYPLNNSIL